jgi:hypothetical protein
MVVPWHLLNRADLQLDTAKTRACGVTVPALNLIEPARILHTLHVVSSMATRIMLPRPERFSPNRSALAPENLTTLAQFSVSSAINFPNSPGVTDRHAAEIGEPRPHFGIGQSCVNLCVEPIHDLSRRIPRCDNAIPLKRLVARHCFIECGNIRECR